MISNALGPNHTKAQTKRPVLVGSVDYSGKRILDLVLASFVTVFILSWMIPIVGLAIVLTSPGPAIFVQTRSGLNGMPFSCFKFRTMRWTAGREPFYQASKNDERVTAIGRFLRRSNLDEMPQFLNVLLGQMSIVGPRPHPIQLDAQFWFALSGYSNRYQVRPGITGLAQARGCRGETNSLQKMKHRLVYDLFYIQKASLRLDIAICLRTLLTMLKGNTDAF